MNSIENNNSSKISQLQILYETAAKMHTLDLDQLLQFILEAVTTHIGFDRSRLYLLDENSAFLICKIKSGMKLEKIEDIKIPLIKNESIIARCILEKKPIIVEDTDTEPGVHQGLKTLFNIKSFAAVPLLGRIGVKGVITADYLYTQKPIQHQDIESLVIFANLAALAIENSEIYQQLKTFNLQLEQKIHEATQDLKATQNLLLKSERISAFGEMAAGLTHEIRNPLTSINLLIDNLMSSESISPSIQEDLTIIHKESKRLNSLMDQLLQLARPNNSNFLKINIQKIIDKTLSLIKPMAKKHQIQIIESIPHQDIVIQGDANQLQQVFINLLLNAIEAIESKGSIKIMIDQDVNKVYIRIIDDGPGMNDELQLKIFEPFFTTKPKGTGLGLATVQKIIHEHDGSIKIMSTPNHGSQFELTFNLFKESSNEK